ncbi:twin-arginine translocation signal domain-containing protein [bacterium]|nr:twin-arginine translocation signal domain-containing protein [bacterium]
MTDQLVRLQVQVQQRKIQCLCLHQYTMLVKKYQDMKKQDANTCDICGKNPCQCKKSDEKELAEDHFNHSINDAFKMLDDLMRQERDLDIEPMLKRLSPELQKQLVQWAQTDGKAAVANDEYPEADWAARINKYLHGVAEGQDDGCPVHGSHGFPNLQADESACTCDFDKLANPSWPDQEMDEGNLNEIDRRGFLKGLGAAALGAAASSVAGKAQAAPVGKNLGDGFLLTTVRLTPNDESKAVFDTKTNTYYTLNLSSDGKRPIFRSLSQFIVVKDGNQDMAFDVGPETKKAMKKAGILNNINEQGVAEDSRAPQHYFDANKDSKVRRNAEVDQSQHKQDWGRDPLDDITHLAFKAGEKVKGMFKKPSELNELGANNPPQATGTSPAPTANTAANVAATTSTLNPQEQKQLDDLLKKAGVVK